MMNGSTCRWILWSTRLAGLNPYSWSAGFTSQAMRHFWSLASNLVIGPAPLFEARMFFQLVSTSPPSGVTSPRPVTTTRRITYSPSLSTKANGLPLMFGKPFVPPFKAKPSGKIGARSALMLVDIVDRVANRRDFLGGVVRDFDPEL